MLRHENPEFIAMHNAGKSLKAIAEHFKVKPDTVRSWLTLSNKAGTTKPSLKIWTASELADIKARWEAGERQESIAVTYGVTPRAITARIEHMGIKRVRGTYNTKPKFWTEERLNQLRELDAKRTHDEDICRIMGVTMHQISGIRYRNGIRKGDQRLWTPEEEAILRNMWATDAGPAQIGERLKRIPSAITGKARRMGLPRKSYPGARRPAHDARTRIISINKARAAARPKVEKPVETPEVIPDHAKPWLERVRGECAYPYGPRGNIHSCCKPVFNEGVYCEGHSATCYAFKVAA